MTMSELHARFRSLDRIAAPDVWADVEERAAAAAPKPLATVGAPLVQLGRLRLPQDRSLRLLLAVALLVVALIVLALIGGSARTPGPPRLVFSSSLAGTGRVYAIDPADGTLVPMFDGSAQRIHVSPDGSHAFFMVVSDAGASLVIARTDGSARRAFRDPGEPELGRVWESIWARDSHAVAWLSWRDSKPTLMIADAETGDPRSIEVPPDPDPQLSWGWDNVHIAWVEESGCESTNARITSIVDAAAGRTLELRQDLDVHGLPVWAHHSTRLAALVAPPDPEPGPGITCGVRMVPRRLEIWDIASDTIQAVPLDVEVDAAVAWSADDRSIWATSELLGRAKAVWRIDVATGSVTQVVRLEDVMTVAWANDATKLAWISRAAPGSEQSDLWTVDLPNGRPRRIAVDVQGSGPEGWPKWSPTAEWIAFHRGPLDSQPDGFHGSISIIRPDGSDERVLVDTRSGVDLSEVDW